MKNYLVLGFLLLAAGCQLENAEIDLKESEQASSDTSKYEAEREEVRDNAIDSLNLRSIDQKSGAWKTLIDIQSIDPSIHVDLKYASSDNFMKMKLYDTITRLYVQKDVAERLKKCQEFLKSIQPTYSLLIYDGVRPVSVQYKMWNALDSIPINDRVKFVSNPKNGSIHNYGAAVDLTICDKNGKALDMGAGYDDIREIAYPKLETHFLATGELSEVQVQNRKMLRKVMTSQNFRNISTEWWHFNACTRQTAKALYLPLK